MKTVVQNTEEWHKLRETRIGASEANIIMGVSEYSTPRKLWKVKAFPHEGERKANNFIQAKGHRTEPRLRAFIEIETGFDFPDEVALSDQYEWLMASLDGCCHEAQELAEFKLVGKEDYDLVVSGQILPQYKPQIMQQLLVTGYKCCHLVVGYDCKEEGLTIAKVTIYPDLEYIQKELFPAVKKFWFENVLKKKEPAPIDADIVEVKDKKLSDMLTRYELILKESEEVQERLKKVKDEIFKTTKKIHSKVICEGIKVYSIKSKDGETIDFKQYIEDEKLEIPSKYKKVKKGSVTQKITFPKAEGEENE